MHMDISGKFWGDLPIIAFNSLLRNIYFTWTSAQESENIGEKGSDFFITHDGLNIEETI